MLRLNKISLTHFKNYEISSFEFKENVIGIAGLNGKGKTNLLDAIYYCCFTKSYFTSSDLMNIGIDRDGFRLQAFFDKNENPQQVICIHRGTGKKEFSLNEIPYEKFSKHIGFLPAVMIAPDDIEIITGGGEMRRRYIDTILCQLDALYLQQLMVYNKVLLQRNSLLKKFAETGNIDESLLDIINQQLAEPGNYIYSKRADLLPGIIQLAKQFYVAISGKNDGIEILYESRLGAQSMENLLLTNRSRDQVLQRTSQGIHRDEISIKMQGENFKNIASQGQRKSLLFALKLAEYETIKSHKGFPPILLLDDVFEKLDNERIKNLLWWVCKQNNGQVFITDTNAERLQMIFESMDIPFQVEVLL